MNYEIINGINGGRLVTEAVKEIGSLGVASQDVLQVKSVTFCKRIPAAKISVYFLIPILLKPFVALP